jgi:hypothetical protein
MRFIRFGLPALLAVTALAAPARAQVAIRVPFVDVQVGPAGGVYVRAPGVVVNVPPGPVIVPAPRPVIVPLRPAPEAPPPIPGEERVLVPPPPPPQPAVVRALTPDQFASSFRPKAGTYEVMLEHPFTGRPVNVRFTLPPGNPRVIVRRLFVEFDYGRFSVIIRFFRDGTVAVRS